MLEKRSIRKPSDAMFCVGRGRRHTQDMATRPKWLVVESRQARGHGTPHATLHAIPPNETVKKRGRRFFSPSASY